MIKRIFRRLNRRRGSGYISIPDDGSWQRYDDLWASYAAVRFSVDQIN